MDNTPAANGRPSQEPATPAKLTPAEAEALIPPPARAKRGFAVLSPEKKREIASMGGKAAHEHGRAHRFTSEEARAAGKKRHQLRMMAAAAAKAAEEQAAAQGQAGAGELPGSTPSGQKP